MKINNPSKDYLKDINPSKAPRGVPQQRWNEGMPRGCRENKDLAWYRGHQCGVHDVCCALEDDGNSNIAKILRNKFNIHENGDMKLE